MTADAERLRATLTAIDRHHAEDPVCTVDDEGRQRPRELVYAERMSAALARLRPDASELLQIAVRCQHLRRWEVDRSEFPEGRKGYLQWRQQRAKRAAEVAAETAMASGYGQEDCRHITAMVQKHGLRRDTDAQSLEDTACLVFLAYEFEPFAAKHEDAKVIDIVRKTWAKMSESGREAALRLKLSERCASLVQRALSDD